MFCQHQLSKEHCVCVCVCVYIIYFYAAACRDPKGHGSGSAPLERQPPDYKVLNPTPTSYHPCNHRIHCHNEVSPSPSPQSRQRKNSNKNMNKKERKTNQPRHLVCTSRKPAQS